MARQLHHLVGTGRRHNVTIRVVPLDAGLIRWSSAGAFTVLRFPQVGTRPAEPTTVYFDGPCGAVYLDKTEEITVYEGIWDSLLRACLTPIESAEFITAIAKEFDHAA